VVPEVFIAFLADLGQNPTSIVTETATIATPTVRNPTVTRPSCHGNPVWPAPVIGERAAVPKIAARVVNTQLA
jgi:hypothetical protein